jgi:hypothetical protein
MKRIILTGLLALLSSVAAAAQARPQTRPTGDACHVYVVDVKKAEKFFEEYSEKGGRAALPQTAAEAAAAGETVFPEFYTNVGEEELTSKTYRFPGSKLFITARVFYTDESMPAESMLVGVGVSEKEQHEDMWLENMAVAEVSYNDETDIVRAKQRLRVGGRPYLVGVECRCKTAAANK